jgi:hypothetical protein
MLRQMAGHGLVVTVMQNGVQFILKLIGTPIVAVPEQIMEAARLILQMQH